MLADPRDNIKPSDEAPALPLLVMASSLLDLALRPTTSPIDVTSIYIVEEALATFLAVSLEDQFMGKEGSARLEEIDVIVKALRYDGLLRGRRLTEDGFSDIPSTILTTTVRAELRGIPGNISQKPGYFDSLIFGAFLNASDGGKLEDLLAASSHPILSSVTDAEIFLTSFAAFATDQASFAPSLPGTGAAVIDENGITPGIIYSGAENDPPSSPSFDKNDPMDLAFVCMSGLIFFAMIILIYLHRVKDKGASHEERIRHFSQGPIVPEPLQMQSIMTPVLVKIPSTGPVLPQMGSACSRDERSNPSYPPQDHFQLWPNTNTPSPSSALVPRPRQIDIPTTLPLVSIQFRRIMHLLLQPTSTRKIFVDLIAAKAQISLEWMLLLG